MSFFDSISQVGKSAFSAVTNPLKSVAKAAGTTASTVATQTDKFTPSSQQSTGTYNLSSFGLAGSGGSPKVSPQWAAETNYSKNGDKPFNVKTETKALIENAPQLDNNANTVNDSRRCAGCATANALLLDKNPADNAKALRKTMGDYKLKMTKDQEKAVDALESGEMTPNQVAELGEMLYTAGTSGRSNADGMGSVELAKLNSTLKKNGAFKTSNVSYKLTDKGQDDHWTTTVKDGFGVTRSADSWPGSDGKGKVSNGDRHGTLANVREARSRDSNLKAEVSLEHNFFDEKKDNTAIRHISQDGTKVDDYSWTLNKGEIFSTEGKKPVSTLLSTLGFS